MGRCIGGMGGEREGWRRCSERALVDIPNPRLSHRPSLPSPNVRLQEIHIAQAIQASQDNPHAAPIVIPIPETQTVALGKTGTQPSSNSDMIGTFHFARCPW